MEAPLVSSAGAVLAIHEATVICECLSLFGTLNVCVSVYVCECESGACVLCV